MCLLSNDIHDYWYVSQGKIDIPGVDDAVELKLTDVSKDHRIEPSQHQLKPKSNLFQSNLSQSNLSQSNLFQSNLSESKVFSNQVSDPVFVLIPNSIGCTSILPKL